MNKNNLTGKIRINKRLKCLPREELEKLDKCQLIDKIVQLEAYNFQLKNLLAKKLDEKEKTDEEYVNLINGEIEQEIPQETVKKTNNETFKNKRKFDFKKQHKRHVLLKLLYFGWNYQGFACQEDSNTTVENYLFKALIRTCLIESRMTSNYHRCGRTDKEVSAFSQVISIDLRSKFPVAEQLTDESIKQEIDYCGILNRVLPNNIQCIAWMPLASNVYSARFDCTARTYRYFFPIGDLNINAMNEACKLLVRHTDFRNFCRMDVHNGVTNYYRHIQKAQVHICPNEQLDESGFNMYYLEICANAFLWHQIRCIMAVLLLIGQGKEEVEVINELLDIEKNPCKPQYTPAVGFPLNLFDCQFRELTTKKSENTEGETKSHITSWVYNESELQRLIETVQAEWTKYSVKTTMIRNVLHNLEVILHKEFQSNPVKSQALILQDTVQPRIHQKLLDRNRCESLDNRIEHFLKKQRLAIEENDDLE